MRQRSHSQAAFGVRHAHERPRYAACVASARRLGGGPPGKVSYGDSYSIGQIAQMWGRPSSFVRQLIADELLTLDEHGLVTNTELRRFYAESGGSAGSLTPRSLVLVTSSRTG